MPVERLDGFQLLLYNNIIARSKKPRVQTRGFCYVPRLTSYEKIYIVTRLKLV